MKRVSLLIAALFLCTFTASAQQENGNWRAANQTAKSITGDIGIAPEKIFINFARFNPPKSAQPLRPTQMPPAQAASTA